MNDAHPVFVTGATGFIGGRLAAALDARGRRLRCLVRDPGRAAALERLGAELIVGDSTDPQALARGLEGVDVAFHLAALYDVGVVDASALERSNIEGTRAFLEAVKHAGTERVVHVSTTAALGPVRSGEGDQSSRWQGPFPTAYHRTKTRAHELARAAQAAGAPVIIVCPAYVYGPGDGGPGGRFLKDLLGGRLPALPGDPAWFSFVHVADVVTGLIAAAESGRVGATYVLSGEPATINEFALLAASLGGVRPPRLRVPRLLGMIAGSVLDVVSRATGRRFTMSREGVAAVTSARWVHNHSLATRELGWMPRPLAMGLPETVAAVMREVG